MVHKRTLDRLREAGKLRAESEESRQRAATILAEEAPRAVEAGMPVAQVAELANVSRRHVYNLLQR